MPTSQQNTVELVVNVVSKGEEVLKQISNVLHKFEKDLKGSTKEASKSEVANKKAAKSYKAVAKDAVKASKSVDKTSKSLKKYNTNAALADKKTKKVSKSMKDFDIAGGGALATFTALAGTLLTLGFPIVKAAQFERSMAEVKAISGATDEQLIQLTATAREMGSTTEYSATQAADGLRYLTMAGLDVAEAIEALPGVLNLAQAGAMDLGRAADIATNILSGFGLPVSELARVNDVLVQTFTNTNSTLEELGYAMTYVAPIAAGLGAEFEEVTAALGLLHNAGMKGSLAGTSLRGMMSRLVSPTNKAQEVLDKLGKRLGGVAVEIRDAQGNWIGFAKLLEQFEDAGLTAAEAMELLGQRAGPGLAALLSAGSDAMEKMAQLNRDAEGRAKTIAKVMHENLVGSWKSFLSIIEDTAIEIGNHLLPVFDSLVVKITSVVASIRSWAQEHPALTASIAKTAVAMVSLVGAITLISGLMFVLKGLIVPLIATFDLIVAGIIAAGTAIAGFVTGAAGITGVMAAVTSGLTLLAAGIAIFLGAFTLSDTFRGWVLDLKLFGRSIEDWVDTFKAYLILGFAEIDEALGGSLSGILSVVVSLINVVLPPMKALFSAIADGAMESLRGIVTLLKYFGLGLKVWFEAASSFVMPVIKGIAKVITGVLGWAITSITGKILKFISLLKKIPGLNKILKTGDIDSVIKSIEELHASGKALQSIALDASEANQTTMAGMRAAAKQTLEDLENEAKARKAYQVLKEREVVLQNRIDAAIKKVITTREVEEKKLRASLDSAKAAYDAQSKIFVNLYEKADGAFEKLVADIDARAEDMWDKAISEDVVADFASMFDDINDEYALSEEERIAKTKVVERDMARARVEAVAQGSADVLALYDTEIDAFRRLETAKYIVEGQTAVQRAEAEERVAKNVQVFAQDIYKTKVSYARKAQAELSSILDDSLKREEDVVNSIIELQKKVADSRKSAEEKIKDLRRSGMSEYQRYLDEVREVEGLLREASAIMATDADKSIDLYNKAMGIAAGLGAEVEHGGRMVVTQSGAIAKAIGLIQQAEQGVAKAGVAGQQVLTENLADQREQSDLVRESLNDIQADIDDLQQSISEALKVKVEVDTAAFNTSVEALGKQALVMLNVGLDFDQAGKELVEWQAETADMVTAIKVPLQLEYDAEITETLLASTELMELLKEEVKVHITKGEAMDATTLALLGLSGIAAELEKEIPVEVDDHGTINVAQQQIIDLVDEIDKIPEEKVIKVRVEYTNSGTWANGESPVVEARATGGLAGFKRLSSRLITTGGGIKDDVPTMLKKKEYVHRPEAVNKYGVQFMEFVNNLRIPVDAVMQLMGNGVSTPVQALSDGGLVGQTTKGLFGLLSQGIPNLSPAIAMGAAGDTTSNITTTRTHNYINIGKDSMPARGSVVSKATALLNEVQRVY